MLWKWSFVQRKKKSVSLKIVTEFNILWCRKLISHKTALCTVDFRKTTGIDICQQPVVVKFACDKSLSATSLHIACNCQTRESQHSNIPYHVSSKPDKFLSDKMSEMYLSLESQLYRHLSAAKFTRLGHLYRRRSRANSVKIGCCLQTSIPNSFLGYWLLTVATPANFTSILRVLQLVYTRIRAVWHCLSCMF